VVPEFPDRSGIVVLAERGLARIVGDLVELHEDPLPGLIAVRQLKHEAAALAPALVEHLRIARSVTSITSPDWKRSRCEPIDIICIPPGGARPDGSAR